MSDFRASPGRGHGSGRSRAREPDGRAESVTLADGRPLAFRRWAGSGEPLVALHGLFDCSLGWKHVAAATERPCVALDLPGFGRSAMPTTNRFAHYAQDILAGLDVLGIDGFSLVGHSLGGAVATALAERARERVLNLTLLAPAGFAAVPLAEVLAGSTLGRLARRAVPLALANPVTAASIYMAIVAHGHPPELQLLRRVMQRAFTTAPGALAANEAIVAAAKDPEGFAQRPVRYHGPVASLCGARDILVPIAHARHVCEALPQTQLTVWNGMGHHPQRERPTQLNEYLACATRVKGKAFAAAA